MPRQYLIRSLFSFFLAADCVRNIDCVFVLDRSGSVGFNNHLIALQFINNVVSFFTIGSNTTRVGVVAYASYSALQFDLNRHTSVSTLQAAIDGIVYTRGGTNTQAGLNDALFLLDPSNGRGARVNSLGIPKITILITGNLTPLFFFFLLTGYVCKETFLGH